MTGAAAPGSRYLLVAGACLLTHNLVLIAGDAAGLPMPAAVLLSFCIVVLLGYALHTRFTFAVSGGTPSLLRYAAAMAGNIPLTVALLWLLVTQARLPMALAAPVTTVLLVALNYLTSRWAITSIRHKGAVR